MLADATSNSHRIAELAVSTRRGNEQGVSWRCDINIHRRTGTILNLTTCTTDHMVMRPILIFATVYSIATLSAANADPQQASLEDRYIATRDAAMAKSSKLYDAGKFDD